MGGYTDTAAAQHVLGHRAHVARGGCAAVAPTKAWCNLRAGHHGPHGATTIAPRGETRPGYTWDHHYSAVCPCEEA